MWVWGGGCRLWGGGCGEVLVWVWGGVCGCGHEGVGYGEVGVGVARCIWVGRDPAPVETFTYKELDSKISPCCPV